MRAMIPSRSILSSADNFIVDALVRFSLRSSFDAVKRDAYAMPQSGSSLSTRLKVWFASSIFASDNSVHACLRSLFAFEDELVKAIWPFDWASIVSDEQVITRQRNTFVVFISGGLNRNRKKGRPNLIPRSTERLV